jgi:hypothetical protein
MGVGRMPPVSRRDFDSRQKRVLNALSQIQTLRNSTVIYPHTVLCDAETCAVVDGRRSLYMDDDHLSPFGSARIAAMVRSVSNLKGAALDRFPLDPGLRRHSRWCRASAMLSSFVIPAPLVSEASKRDQKLWGAGEVSDTGGPTP